jgi:two-component system, OmpR family, response regulator
MKLLLVEDDEFVADSLALALRDSGYSVYCATDGLHAEIVASTEPYDVIILDLGLPGIDGLQFLQRIRKKQINVPVLILTARDSYEARIEGLDAGANDYVTKPFHLGELEARIRAMLRIGYNNATMIDIGELTWDTKSQILKRGDEVIELSPREYEVLGILFHNLGALVTKQRMSSLLSNWDEPATYNAIDIIIHRLRKKLEPHGLKLRTIRGLGFLAER